jgi:hypothetical protein
MSHGNVMNSTVEVDIKVHSVATVRMSFCADYLLCLHHLPPALSWWTKSDSITQRSKCIFPWGLEAYCTTDFENSNC